MHLNEESGKIVIHYLHTQLSVQQWTINEEE